MNIKSLITTSVVALVSASAVQAADVVIPHEVAPVITAPAFSWTGFYLGAQIGGLTTNSKRYDDSLKRDLKLSGIVGGLYAGYNVDLGSGVVFGFDTDVALAGKKDTVDYAAVTVTGTNIGDLNAKLTAAKITNKDGLTVAENDTYTESVTLKEKWKGATRVRVGFAADRVMPYIAGGVAYTQIQGINAIEVKKDAHATTNANKVVASGNVYDETKSMIGFTLGAGIDFAMTDNVLLRAEYRYSDYGKKKYFKDTAELTYKTNDFRVGVAYKF